MRRIFSCFLLGLLCTAVAFAEHRMAVAPGPASSAPSLTIVYRPSSLRSIRLAPYPGAMFGGTVGFADVDGDARAEVLTGPGPSPALGPHVRAFRPDTGSPLLRVSFYAYGTSRSGVNPDGADIDLPAAQAFGIRDEILTGPGPGAVFGPHVRGFELTSAGVKAMPRVSFYAYQTLKYGAKVHGGDVNGDLFDEILTAPGPGPVFGADVRGFGFETGSVKPSFSLLVSPCGYGAEMDGGDMDGDGMAEIVGGGASDPGCGARIRGFNIDGGAITVLPGLDFLPFTQSRYGVKVAAGGLLADSTDELLAAPGPDPAAPAAIRGFDYQGGGVTPIARLDFVPFATSFGAHPAVGDSADDLPAGFLFGTATAAHQVEGGNTKNDWYEWEQLGKTPPAGAACEEWSRYDQDFALAEGLGMNAHRFSIEWSRVEPAPGFYDPVAVQHYHDLLASLKAHGARPIVTLHHFTNPTWVLSPLNPGSGLGGWTNPATVDAFVRFADFCAREYGGEVDDWVTINEPVVTVFFGYLLGAFPPGGALDFAGAEAAAANMIRAHARAYDAIHAADTIDADGDGVAAAVSIAHHTRWYLSKDPTDPKDRFAAAHLAYLGNDLFPNAVIDGLLDLDWDGAYTSPGEGYHPELASRMDYFGINYYGTYVVQWMNLPPLWGVPLDNPDPNVEKSECGTEVYPQGLFRILEGFHRKFGLPFLITENGLCDADDNQRESYVVRHLRELLRAMGRGAVVTGYCHWSLLDNYEWTSGYGPKFGLLEVDFATQARTVRPSANALAGIIGSGVIP